MILEEYLSRQLRWFLKTFGPGARDAGLIEHIKKELDEIREAPGDIEEWCDVIILAAEGALRNAKSPNEIDKVNEVVACLQMKQDKNIARVWPDWVDVDPDKPIEHMK